MINDHVEDTEFFIHHTYGEKINNPIVIRFAMNRRVRLSVPIPVKIRLGLKWIINDVLANQFCSAIINYRQGVRFKPYTLCGFPTVITYERKLRARSRCRRQWTTRRSCVNLVSICWLAKSAGRCAHY